MSTQNNPPKTPELKINEASKQKVEAIKENLASTLNTPTASSDAGKKAKPTLTVKILNDDLADFLNQKQKIPGVPDYYQYTRFTDGGPLSSQLSINASFPFQKGILKNGSLTLEGNATTSTGWTGNYEWIGATANSESPMIGEMYILDGYQLPKSENYRLTAVAHKPLTINNHQLDLNIRADAGYVSSNSPIQDWWHKLGNTNYFRTTYNKAESRTLANLEVTGAYNIVSKTHLNASLLAGTSLGNTYQGVMAGAEVSVGSTSSRYFPQQVHSAQFGNTNPDRIVQGGQAEPGAYKFSAYGKIYGSTQQDPRTKLPNSLINEVEKRSVEIYGEHFTNKFIGYATSVSMDGKQTYQIPQYTSEEYRQTLNIDIPYPIERYQKNPITFEGGIRAQYQISKAVTAGISLGVISNLAKPVASENYLAQADKVKEFLENKTTVLRLSGRNLNPRISPAPGAFYFAIEQRAGDNEPASLESKIKLAPAASPTHTFTGQVTVNIALGGTHKKDKTPSR